ncbi:sensor histidine kinase [Paraburkholderia phenoliruptrix]|uniref:sensor histidine kinase n=1 Tax=Paraburkholderia phenoliruptrix TaxID=252970 RepID=UPI0028698AEB|nr:sensor histidine kinase [Paraburkholderia phenoliruptrix]WMY09519.1 sensor histidine kinase [Paraburkholderia phenoliruptrix]
MNKPCHHTGAVPKLGVGVEERRRGFRQKAGLVSGGRKIALMVWLIRQRTRLGADRLALEVRERERTELELLESREQLRRLSAHQEAIREEDRKQIAMTIHDELGQLLTAINMEMSLLRLLIARGEAWIPKADDIGGLIQRTMLIVRNVASHLRPAALNFGLASALEWLVQDFSRHNAIECSLRIEGCEPSLSDERATAVFRIVQEALTNVSRHANASRVEVLVNSTARMLEIIVKDDGMGFDVTRTERGLSYGLQGMAERARMIGAQLRIDSKEQSGSAIRLCFDHETAATTDPVPRI